MFFGDWLVGGGDENKIRCVTTKKKLKTKKLIIKIIF